MGGSEESKSHSLRGPIDADRLITVREIIAIHAPFMRATVDDLINPTVLAVAVPDGLTGESAGRFDIQWTTLGDYKYHYTEPNLDFRWDHHPHGGHYDVNGDAHFHPPPDATSDPEHVEASFLSGTQPQLVTRTILKNWRAAYHEGLDVLNEPGYGNTN